MDLLPLRLPPGADLRRALETLALPPGWGGAFVVSGIGSLLDPRLRCADANEATRFAGPFELLTLAGSIAPGAVHLHATLADARGSVVGGHLVHGSLIRTTVELLLAGVTGARLTRALDPLTGYDELVVMPTSPDELVVTPDSPGAQSSAVTGSPRPASIGPTSASRPRKAR